MNSIVRYLSILTLLIFGITPCFAQLSDLHYLPPLKQVSGAFVDQLIYLSTPETTAFNVNVYQGTSTTPVTTLSVSKSAGATYNPGSTDNNVTLLTADRTGLVQSNSGLRFESENDEKFYVSWRGKSANQASSLTSKGRAALGTAFKWVGAPNMGTNTSILTNSMGIMATEDNTTVNIFGYNPACTFRQGTVEAGITADNITVTLNKGQTYVLEAPATNVANQDGWIGASVTSDKAIAVNVGEMHYQPRVSNTQDCGIDQIIPENTLGKDYIFVRGNGIDDMEFPVIIATQNDTKIYVNGSTSPVATINSGDYYKIPATYYSQTSSTGSVPGANMFVHTSKEAYAVQSLAGTTSDATGDLNFIAPVNCLLSHTIDNISNVANMAGLTISGGITIIASTAIADENIVVTSGGGTVPTSTLTAAMRTVAGTSDWKTYYLSGLTGDVTVSSNGPLAVGYFGFSGVAGASGYFSGFETIPTIEVERIGDGCLPSTILTATPGFTAYTWYKDGVVVPGITSNSYTPNEAGKFTVTVNNGSCSYATANQYIYDCNPEIILKTTADKNGIIAGETVTFKVSVSLLSEFNVDDLVLTNLIPSNVTVTGTSATYGTVSNTGSTYTWNIGTIRNGEEHILTITATGNAVSTPTAGTLTVSKTQTITMGTEANKVPDDFEETVTVYSALATEPASQPTGLYFTNTGSAAPYNNVMHFTAASGADGYLVVRQTGSAPTFVPTDGTSYSTDSEVSGGEIIYVGSNTTITELSATSATDYHYTIYAYNGGGAATNYLLTNPVTAVINNPASNSISLAASAKSSSAGLANKGVNVTFVDGVATGGTTITASKFTNTVPANYSLGLSSGLHSVRDLYYTVSSSAASPGNYTIALDFSGLNMTASDWNDAVVLKRSNSSSPWIDVTSQIIDRSSDGLVGNIVIAGLNSFSDFAIGSTSSTLPLTWQDFSVHRTGSAVRLDWKTASEQNTRDFIVQHSTDASSWLNIATVAAANQSNTTKSYMFVDSNPSGGFNYYRIMQRDLDGNQSYSQTKGVKFELQSTQLEIIGNPVVNGILQLQLSGATKEEARFYTAEGKLLMRKNLIPGMNSIELHRFAKGVYLLKMGSISKRIVVQ